MISNEELAKLAVTAKSKSIATYSNFHVGAALQTNDGKVIIGANIENASYGLTMCAPDRLDAANDRRVTQFIRGEAGDRMMEIEEQAGEG